MPIRGQWFAVLPDHPGTADLATRIRAISPDVMVIPHTSGRPFVLGRWQRAVIQTTRDSVSLLIGETDPATEQLDSFPTRPATMPGSVHLIAADSDGVRVRGTASGLRQVFYTEAAAGITIAADRADILATVTGAGLDPTGLGLRLLSPVAPWPLTWRPLWSGISAVEPGHELCLTGPSIRRWWSPPDPTRSLDEASEALREALTTAVSIRCGGGLIACDVSGLDSSSLLALAARRGGSIRALTYEADDPMDEDAASARYLVAALRTSTSSEITHDVLAADLTPLPFEGMLDDPGLLDGPTWVTSYHRRIQAIGQQATAAGAALRLAGYGGDELMTPPPVWLADIARRHPVRGVQLARQLQAKYRFPPGELARLVAPAGSYATWLAGCLREADARPSEGTLGEWQTIGWGVRPIVPPWATPEAVHLIRAAVDAQGTAARPLATSRGMHTTLEQVHAGAQAARYVAQSGDATGLPVAAPYFDDHVMEACLAVRPEQAIDPRRYKPLLTEAMTGLLPAKTVARTSTSEIALTVELGWRRHRGEILEVLAQSRLEDLGLIDAEAVRRICHGPYQRDSCGPVRTVLEIETWLRSVADHAVTGGSR